MRKFLTGVALVVALVVPAAALAATLDTGKFGDLISYGDKCANGAYYHFVLNQVSPDYRPGVTLTTTFDPAAQTPGNPVTPDPVLRKVQHFYVFSAGELQSATTTFAGEDAKLVLSDVSCKK